MRPSRAQRSPRLPPATYHSPKRLSSLTTNSYLIHKYVYHPFFVCSFICAINKRKLYKKNFGFLFLFEFGGDLLSDRINMSLGELVNGDVLCFLSCFDQLVIQFVQFSYKRLFREKIQRIYKRRK